MTFRSHSFFLFLVVCFAISCLLLSLSKGSTSIPIYQLLFSEKNQFNAIFFQLRLPRTLTAFVCGSLLALAGSLMQLLLQNPLADPYVLGISGGAALTTLLMMLAGIGAEWYMVGAWLGGLITIAFILFLARNKAWQAQTLLLAGIALACGFSACISFILLMAPNTTLHSMLFWLNGDLNNAQLPWAGILILFLGLIFCFLLAPGLNIFSRGEIEARSLGLANEKYRLALYLLSSLFTAAAVTLCGCIGFIGLIIPHLTRCLIGFDQRIALPSAALLGGGLLTLADTLARTLFAPQQIPVGILMAILGVPVFVWMLQK